MYFHHICSSLSLICSSLLNFSKLKRLTHFLKLILPFTFALNASQFPINRNTNWPMMNAHGSYLRIPCMNIIQGIQSFGKTCLQESKWYVGRSVGWSVGRLFLSVVKVLYYCFEPWFLPCFIFHFIYSLINKTLHFKVLYAQQEQPSYNITNAIHIHCHQVIKSCFVLNQKPM